MMKFSLFNNSQKKKTEAKRHALKNIYMLLCFNGDIPIKDTFSFDKHHPNKWSDERVNTVFDELKSATQSATKTL